MGGEHLGGSRRIQRQHVGDRAVVHAHGQRLLLEAVAAARLAADGHVGQEAHLQLLHPLARALRAAAFVHVEGEAAWPVAADARLGGGREQRAHVVPDADVGGRAGARRLADGRLVDLQGAAQRLPPLDRAAADPAGAGRTARAPPRPRRQPLPHLVEQQPARQRALAGAAHAGDAGDRRQRDAHVHPAQVVQRRLPDREPAGLRIALPPDHRVAARRAQHPPGGGGVVGHHLLQTAVRDHPAAAGAAARPQVDDVVGAADGLLVVLDHDHGVAPLLQPPQGDEQQVVVARVHADGRLVQHVADAAELRAELCGQADALRLAATQGGRRAVQSQVAQPHLVQEAQPGAQLADDVAGDRPLPVVEPQGTQRRRQRLHRQRAQVVDGAAAQRHRQRFRAQAASGARPARHLRPLPRLVPPRFVAGVLGVEAGQLQAGAVALRAPAVLGVEGEQARVELREAAPAARAGTLGRMDVDGPGAPTVERADVQGAAPELQRLRDGGFDGGAGVAVDVDGGDRRVDVVLAEAVQARPGVGGEQPAVDHQLTEALAGRPGGQVGVVALAPAHQRRQHHQPLAGEPLQDGGADGPGALRLDGDGAVRTVLDAQAHVQQPQEVVDLGQRGDRALAAAAAGALLDRHRRRHAGQPVQVGARGRLHELADVGVQRLQVAALPLREQHVEGQRALAGARDPGDHREPVARNGQVDRAQVVLPRPPHLDGAIASRHRRRGRCGRARSGGLRLLPVPVAQRQRGVRAALRGELAGRTGGDDPAAGLTALGTQLDDVIGGGQHVQVVLHHEQRVAGGHQAAQRVDQHRDVRDVQARGGLVHQKQHALPGLAPPRSLRSDPGQVAGDLQPLRLASRQRGYGLAQGEVA